MAIGGVRGARGKSESGRQKEGGARGGREEDERQIHRPHSKAIAKRKKRIEIQKTDPQIKARLADQICRQGTLQASSKTFQSASGTSSPKLTEYNKFHQKTALRHPHSPLHLQATAAPAVTEITKVESAFRNMSSSYSTCLCVFLRLRTAPLDCAGSRKLMKSDGV